MEKMTVPACREKKAAVRRVYTGSLALQDIRGLISMVSILSLLLSSVRVAMMAGTLHPNPISIGMKDLPCRPSLCMALSIINAALAI